MARSLFHRITRHAFYSSFSVFAASLLVGFLVLNQSNEQYEEIQRADALIIAQNKASLIENQIIQNVSANYTLGALVQEFGGHTYWFDDVAESMLESHTSIASVSLSPGGIVTKVYPLEGNEALLDFNQLEDKKQRAEVVQARLDQKLTLAGPLELVQGGMGVVGRLPVRVHDRWGNDAFWGFTNVVIELSELLAHSNIKSLEQQGYFYRLVRLRDEAVLDNITVASNAGLESLVDPVTVQISLPNSTWGLGIVPKQGWLPLSRTLNGIAIVVAVALVLARLAWLASKAKINREELRQLLQQRTAQMDLTNHRHLSTLRALPDYLLELDEEGIITFLHTPQDEAAHLAVFSVGATAAAMFSKQARSTFESALNHARTVGQARGIVFDVHHGDQKRWFELSIVYNQPNVERPYYVVLARDVTERHKAEEDLQIAATAFNSQDGILITNKRHEIIRVNSSFERISGFKQEEVIGRSPNILRSGRHDDNFYQMMNQRLETEGVWHGEIWNKRKNGEIYPERLSISSVKNHTGEITHFVATFRDISDEKANQRRIQQLHYYDPLTQLPNKTLLLEEMEHLIDDVNLGLRRSAVLFIDIDEFKVINDVYGHNMGDLLLQQAASRLLDSVRPKDIVARFGADEFVVVLEDMDASMSPERIAYRARHVSNRILDVMATPFELEDITYNVTASIGICLFGKDSAVALDIIKQAELAMYEAKGAGRNQSCFYLPKMQQRILERVEMDSDLRRAMMNHEFLLHFQPQWNAERKMVGVEALVRWLHPVKGMIPPGLFIPFAEESRLILPLGDWVLMAACQTKARWLKEGYLDDVVMAINVSAMQFAQEDFIDKVRKALAHTQVPPHLIQLELTESMLVHDQEDVIQKMRSLKELGVLISLDDFGTGYSSLSYLQQLPIDQLKIDQSFVARVMDSKRGASIAASIIGLGHNLGMEVIAEGVEEDAQFQWLKQQGCDLFQGYGLSRPLEEKILIGSFVKQV